MSGESVRIGLEIHVQITTLKSKLFCSCPTDYRGKPANTNVCPVCLGLPGALPVVNEEAIKKAIMTALALNCKVNPVIIFSRKHYFYPDLPKNYQITQYAGVGAPIGVDGYIDIYCEGKSKRVRIKRVHLEEDPGRLVYPGKSIVSSPYVLIDYNRSGIALLEIVTEPDMTSPREARILLDKLRAILEYLEVSDLTLEGAMRVDANISIPGGERIEIKNIGSISDVERALAYEIVRQREILRKGGRVKRETRHWDSLRGVTVSLREKEEEEDYRYFPDPDLPPIVVPSSLVEEIKASLPELPDQKARRFIEQYSLPEHIARTLVLYRRLAEFFEEAVKIHYNPKRIASILITDYLSCIKRHGLRVGEDKATPEKIAKLVKMVDEGTISVNVAKELIFKIILDGVDPEVEVKRLGLTQVEDLNYMLKLVREVFSEYPKAVEDAKRNPRAINFLVGMVMRKCRGRLDPRKVRDLIVKELKLKV